MKDISEKVSYLQGLSEGLGLADGNPQGRIVTGILEVLEEIADTVIALGSDFESIKEYLESLDDDLCHLEENLMPNDKEVVEFECPACGEDLYFEAELLNDEDVLEITCPNCNDVIYINDGAFDFDFDSSDEADEGVLIARDTTPS